MAVTTGQRSGDKPAHRIEDDRREQVRARRAAAVPPAAAPSSPYRRRWGWIAAGVVAVLLGGFITANAVASAGNRVEVLSLARDVGQYETIGADDLARVRVAVDSGVETVPAADLDEVVGRVAATDLVGGGLLAPDQLRSSDERLLGAGETIIGLLLSPSDAPLGQLQAGAQVFVVVRPASGDPVEMLTVDGWLFDTSAAARPNGDRPVSVVIPATEVGAVSAAAGEGRVTVSVREE